MGILSKVFKGIKKFFKKVGKGIKKVVKKVGKFANKLGIVGQLGLMFILPHIGAGLMKGLTGLGTTLVGQPSLIARGLGAILNTGLKFATTAGNVYRTVTGAVTDFIGTAGKYVASKLPGGAPSMSLGEAWTAYSGEVMKNVKSIVNPFKANITVGLPGQTVADLAKSVGMSPEQLKSNFSFPDPIKNSLSELSGDELAKYSLDTVTQTGMAPGVLAVTRLSEPYSISRNTDFFGFPIEAPSALPSLETEAGMTYEDLSRLGTGEVKALSYEDLSKVGTGRQGSAVSLMANPADVPEPPERSGLTGYYEETLVPQAQALPGQVVAQTFAGAAAQALAGDQPEPTYEELSRGGVSYHQDSDTTVAQAIRYNPFTPVAEIPIMSMIGNNTFSSGSINANNDYNTRLQKGLGFGGPPIYGF